MRARATIFAAALAATCLAGAGPAAAERLVTSLSSHRVMITQYFTGEELVLFGSVERDANTVQRRGGYDIVATVTGPRESLVTRRKDRVLGIWVNVDSRTFVDAPSYLAILTNRPVAQIADPETLRRMQIGLDNMLFPQRIGVDLGDVPRNDPLRAAFLRLQRAHHLYVEEPNGVTFLTPTLYRASIPLPAQAPIGTYEVDVKLLADGTLVARERTAFELYKVGFEQVVANAARYHGLAYGLGTAGLALFVGWLASVVFRRD